MAGPGVDFWQQRFEAGQTPWDRGASNPQLAAWLDSGELAPCRILVPGCGSGHEVAELAIRGFEVVALDYAPAAVERTRERLAGLGAPAARASVVCADALEWQPDAPFDAIYEQTCLCALYPDHWAEYAQQLHRWLKPGGRLFALFVQTLRPGAAEGFIQGPPYHCDIHGMRALFPGGRWDWPKPPYPRVEHPSGMAELAVVLGRRALAA
ncbi:MAG TPA: methyltransferase domain-containing protein [Quisquiliibacterium sp.]|nr:methyltransferase domain-containing protein [Quisquiliibacterium sp.]